MRRVFQSVLLSASVLFAAGLPAGSSAVASEADRPFFAAAAGNWAGAGEIVAGKYKGTKFNCSFAGTSQSATVGLTLDGGCRVGVFTQKMKAVVEGSTGRGYTGVFMDGSEGKGLDIVSGNVVDGTRVVLAINRKQLSGVMQARIKDKDTMNVTVSVRVAKQLVPVIGLSLKRVDATEVGSIAE